MATAPTPTPSTVDQLIKKGAMLHKFSVVDDKNNASLLGTFLDDAHGPPSQSILNHLICRNEYEKNLPLITSLDSFALIAYSKEKDYRRTTDFIGYLQGRKKAAKILLDKNGTVGYLYPGPYLTTPDGIPCLRCYYESGRSRSSSSSSNNNKKRPAPTFIDGTSASTPGAGPPTPTGASATKRIRAAGQKPAFQYIPPDPIPPSSPSSSPSSSSQNEKNGPIYLPGNGGGAENGGPSSSSSSSSTPPPPLPDPSQFPRSQDARFKYVPPTPMEGQIPPPFYDDPDACPVIEGLTLTPDQAALAASGAAAVAAAAATATAAAATAATARMPPSPAAAAGGAGGAWGKDQKVAEGFYNQLKREKGTRNQSLVFHLRKLNNWVKAQLINSLKPAPVEGGKGKGGGGGAGRELEVLDLACGKGGDFTKWREVSRRYPIARYVGVDIAKSSLVDAIGRYHQDKGIRGALGSTLTLACADLGGTDLVEDEVEVWEATEDKWGKRPLLDEEDTFDCITMQFALHYMFETEGRARRFLQVVAKHLRKRGTFIATTVDARVVVEMLAGLGRKEGGREDGGEGGWVARLVDEGKRELCRLQVDEATYQQLFKPPKEGREGGREEEDETPFCGLRYKFLLRDGSEEDGAADAVNAPEWMIPLPFLEAAAREYGLKLEKAQNFHELVEENRAQIDGGRAGGIRWVNYQGSISQTEWDIARIYVALKFTRI